MIKVSADEQLDDLTKNGIELGQQVQRDRFFRQALKAGDRNRLSGMLNEPFAQMFVTSDVLSLAKIRVYDRQYQFVAASDNGLKALR